MDVMEKRLGGLSAHMLNSMQRLSVPCAKAWVHNGSILNGRADDLSKEVHDMELRLQLRMDSLITGCTGVCTRLEHEFIDVAIHLDTTSAEKTMGLATKMDTFMSNMDNKFSLQLARHDEVSTFHHEQMSKEGVKLTKAFAELEQSNLRYLSASTQQLDANITTIYDIIDRNNDTIAQQQQEQNFHIQ